MCVYTCAHTYTRTLLFSYIYVNVCVYLCIYVCLSHRCGVSERQKWLVLIKTHPFAVRECLSGTNRGRGLVVETDIYNYFY